MSTEPLKLEELPAIPSIENSDIMYIVKDPDGTPTDYKVAFSALQAAIAATVGSFVLNVKDYGATGDGTTDDYTAIQNAINAANTVGGGTVFFPIGTYLTKTALTLKSFVKFEGQGFNKSIIKVNNSNDMFHFAAENISHLEFYNLSLTASGGHIFFNSDANGKIGYTIIHHCFLTQNDPTKSWWYQTDGNMISMLIVENYFYAGAGVRTHAPWYNIDPHGGANSNWWRNNTFEMDGSNTTQPCFYIECQTTNDYTYDNHWVENVFEVCNGGSIKLLSTFGSTIESCYSYDTTGQLLPMIYLGKSSLGIRSTNTTIRNCGRIGSNIGVGVPDFQFDSHTRQVVIDSCRTANDTLLIDCGNCTQVTLINIFIPGGTTIINPPSGGFMSAELHDNGGLGYDIKAFGATGDGVTDDSPAIQACINYVATLDAPGGTVLVPVGVYLCNTALTLKTRIKLLGNGYTSQIKTTGSNAMFTWSGSIAFTEMANLRLVANAGDIFAPAASANWSQGRFDKIFFSQANSGKYVWNQPTGSLSNMTFKKCDFFVSGVSRTVPAFYHLDTASGSHDNLFEDCVCTYGDTCNNQPFFYIECTNGASGYTYAWHWKKVQFETCDGGSIKLLSAFGCTIVDTWTVDNSSMELPFILIDKSGTASALPSTANTIRNSGRRNGAVDTAVVDIKLGSSTRQTIIEQFRCVPDNGTIDVNSSTDCYILQVSSGTTINNVSATTTILRNGGVTGIGIAPTARMHIGAGTATAGTAPLKLTTGVNLGTPETGAFEFDGSNLYFTIGGVRKTITVT